MGLAEVKAIIEANKEDVEVVAYLNGFSSLDVFKGKMTTDTGFKSYMDAEKDKHAGKSLETWKTNNLQKLINEGVAKANPQETAEQKLIRELTERLDKQETETKKKDLIATAMKLAGEKGLPLELVERFIGEDEESTKRNIEALEVSIGGIRKQFKEKQGQQNNYDPNKNNNPAGYTGEKFSWTKYGQLMNESAEKAEAYKIATQKK